MGRPKIDRTGEKGFNSFGSKMVIVEYTNCSNMKVLFPEYNWIAEHVQYDNFKRGHVWCPREYRGINEIGKTFKDEKRDITIIDIERRTDKSGKKVKYYKYHCNKCGNEDWISQSNLRSKSKKGCNVCGNSPKKVLIGYNDIATTNPEIIKYLANEDDAYKYSQSTQKKIKVKCPNCGYKKEMAVASLIKFKGFVCPKCSDGISYPNKFMFSLLTQLDIDFKDEYSPDWAGSKSYDFYIPSMNLIIEMDGGYHNRVRPNDKRTLQDIKDRDKLKNELALNHNIKLIRVDAEYKGDKFKYLKDSVLNSELVNYLDFSIINWYELEKSCLRNKLIESCEYYTLHKNEMNLKEMASQLNITPALMSHYVRKGHELNICVYDNYNYNKQRKIRVIETDEIFNGIRECIRYFESAYNIKLHSNNILDVLKGKQENHKGFHFEYID